MDLRPNLNRQKRSSVVKISYGNMRTDSDTLH